MFDFLDKGVAQYISFKFGKFDKGNITQVSDRLFNVDVGKMSAKECLKYLNDMRLSSVETKTRAFYV